MKFIPSGGSLDDLVDDVISRMITEPLEKIRGSREIYRQESIYE